MEGGTGNNVNANAGGTGGAVAGGTPNNNKNLNNLLNVVNANRNAANNAKFAKAFTDAASLAAGARFKDIADKCNTLATTLTENTKINLSTKFGKYGNKNNNKSNKINDTSLNKVKTFMEIKTNSANPANAPSRAAILVKILQEIKKLVKKQRNSNRKAADNIKTAVNFNQAIISLINAVIKAKGSAPGNAPTPGN